jgi:RNA polymerase sigma factor (sigma-70 family)
LTADPQKPTEPAMSSERVHEVYEEHAESLQRFLLGVLKDESAASDALQSTFIKLIEKGHSVQRQDSIKSWLFRVAFNEAMLIRRRETIRRKHVEGVAWKLRLQLGDLDNDGSTFGQSVEWAIRQEDILLVRKALDSLSEPQKEVVKKRIYEGLKFREIADDLDVPLGTVLARMQAGLKKLKPILAHRVEWTE